MTSLIIVRFGNTLPLQIMFSSFCLMFQKSLDITMLDRTEEYVCYMKVPGVEHEIALINPYHPSSARFWYSGFDKFKKYMLQLLGM